VKFGFQRKCSWRIWLRNQNTGGRAPIPGKEGGCPIKEKHQALDPPPEPAAQGGWGRDPIRIQALRRGLFEAPSVREPLHGCLAGRQTIRGTRNAPGRQHREGTLAPVTFSAPDPDPVMFTVVRGSPSSPVTDHRHLPASGTLARQPFADLLSDSVKSFGKPI
jgi:hypothetical protein